MSQSTKSKKKSTRWKEVIRSETAQVDMGVEAHLIGRRSPLKRKLFEFLYHPQTEIFILILVFLSVVLLVVEIMQPNFKGTDYLSKLKSSENWSFFLWMDMGLSFFFLGEYLLKFWLAPKKIRFVMGTWIDLLAIFPLLRVFRLGRVARIFRLFKLVRAIRFGALLEADVTAKDDQADTVVIGVYLIFSIIFGSVAIMVFEKGNNDSFQNFGDGVWWCIVTLTTVGYGDLYPTTPGGKAVAGVIMFIGLSFFALLTGTISTVLIDRAKTQREKKMHIDGLEDHVIICNWNENGTQLLENLLEESQTSILIIANNAPRGKHHRVHHLKGDPTTDLTLTRANVEQAKVMVILANSVAPDSAAQDVDARTILTALAVERRNSALHTIIELINPENSRHAEHAGVDEVMIAGAFTGSMLAQTAASPGLTSVFTQLFQQENIWLTTSELPEGWEGITFAEAAAQSLKLQLGSLVGLLRDGESLLDPNMETTIKSEDQLVLVRRLRV